MSTVTKDRPTDTPTNHDNDPRMVHISYPPYTHGVCGKKLVQGIDMSLNEVDCVVCAEMDRAYYETYYQ